VMDSYLLGQGPPADLGTEPEEEVDDGD
jgi:hypothetical protein